jgi:hypothetical protein
MARSSCKRVRRACRPGSGSGRAAPSGCGRPAAARRGGPCSGLIDFEVEAGAGTGAWGAGPRSGDRWWTGFGHAPEDISAFENWRGRACDILMYFAPAQNFNNSWDDIAGGPGDDPSELGGTLLLHRGSEAAWRIFSVHKERPAHFCIPLVPREASNRRGANPKVWWDIAAGEHDVHFRRLGRRMAYLEEAHGRSPSTPLMLDLGWEHSGRWYHWSIAGSYEGKPAHTRFPVAFARIVDAIRRGYRSHADRDCPYKFVWRPSRQAVERGVRHAAFYPGDEVVDLIAISVHDNEPQVRPDNWKSRRRPWPDEDKPDSEGWDPMAELAQHRSKPLCFPEWSPQRVDEPNIAASPYPGEFVRMVRSYIEEHVELFAYDCYFHGKVSSMLDHPDWEGSIEYRRLWGKAD